MRARWLWLLATFGLAHGADITLTEGTALSVDARDDGTVAFDLLDGLWLLPPGKSAATRQETGRLPVREPRFSPDGTRVLFLTNDGGRQAARIVDLASGRIEQPGDGSLPVHDADWHPSGERLVFSARDADGLDIRELDLRSGVHWRLTGGPGDEFDPAWSADGRDLVFIERLGQTWRVMLRRFGLAPIALHESDVPLSSPTIRPGKSLVTFVRHGRELSMEMLILSSPILKRTLVREDDLFATPIVWLDRQRMLYAANGQLRERDFNSWIPRNRPFRATIAKPVAQPLATPRRLPTEDGRRWTLRVGHALTPDGRRFSDAADIVIRGNRIDNILPAGDDRPAVLDLGEVFAVPGIIDLDAGADAVDPGPLLLSLGVTSVVADPVADDSVRDRAPRLLPADWRGNLRAAGEHGVVISRSADAEAPLAEPRWSPAGRQYADQLQTRIESRLTYLNYGGSDPDAFLSSLGAFRPALPIARWRAQADAGLPVTPPVGAPAVVGSARSGLPAGPGTINALQGLAGSGRNPQQVLAAATQLAADVLGLGDELGRLERGAIADVVLLGANPLSSPNAWLRVVGVVSNGRFYSASGLLDET